MEGREGCSSIFLFFHYPLYPYTNWQILGLVWSKCCLPVDRVLLFILS
jgi:hypothetical protein